MINLINAYGWEYVADPSPPEPLRSGRLKGKQNPRVTSGNAGMVVRVIFEWVGGFREFSPSTEDDKCNASTSCFPKPLQHT